MKGNSLEGFSIDTGMFTRFWNDLVGSCSVVNKIMSWKCLEVYYKYMRENWNGMAQSGILFRNHRNAYKILEWFSGLVEEVGVKQRGLE